jgi:hypothetical protein
VIPLNWFGTLLIVVKLDPKVETTSLRKYMQREDWKEYLSRF